MNNDPGWSVFTAANSRLTYVPMSTSFDDFLNYTRTLRAVNLCPDDFGAHAEDAFSLWLARDTPEGVTLEALIEKYLLRFPNSGPLFACMRDHIADMDVFDTAMLAQRTRVMTWLEKQNKL